MTFTILAEPVADVDLSFFERIAYFQGDVVASPLTDLRVGIKGMKTSGIDRVEDCQNSVFITFDSPADEFEVDQVLYTDPFIPRSLYSYNDQDYVELEYTYALGNLSLQVYFLITVEDCIFAIEDGNGFQKIDFEELWDTGNLVSVK
jgi:hypothetical protein